LELAAIQAGTEAQKEPFDEWTIFEGRLPVIHKYITYIMQDYFKVITLYVRWYGQTTMTFVGRKNDVEIAKEVYNRLITVFDYLWKQYKTVHRLTNREKASYMFGLKTGLDSKLFEQQNKTKKETIQSLPEPIRADCGEKLELAIVTEQQNLQKALVKMHPKLGKGRGHNYGFISRRDVYSDGQAAGRNINTSASLALN